MLKRFVLVAAFFGPQAIAQTTPLTETKAVELAKTADAPLGWKWVVSTIAGFNIIDKTNVVGESDGKTQVYSLKLNTEMNHYSSVSEWKNALTLNEVFSRSPALDRAVKTSDELKLLSFYKYFFTANSMFGLYGRGSVETTALDTYDERAEESTYTVVKQDGTSKTEVNDRYRTATAFKPMTTKESTGLIAKLTTAPLYKIEARFGLGAKQYFAKGSYQASDDGSGNIALVEIPDNRIAGLELASELSGTTSDNKVKYLVYGEALYPFAYSPKSDSDAEESKLVSTEVGADITFAMYEWMGISYTAKSKREPLLQPKAQVTHSLLATVTLATGN